MTSSNGNIFALLAICVGNSPVPGEFPAQRPVTRSFDIFFDLRLNKRPSKQSWGWWFETLSRPLWRHRNDIKLYCQYIGNIIHTCLSLTRHPAMARHDRFSTNVNLIHLHTCKIRFNAEHNYAIDFSSGFSVFYVNSLDKSRDTDMIM